MIDEVLVLHFREQKQQIPSKDLKCVSDKVVRWTDFRLNQYGGVLTVLARTLVFDGGNIDVPYENVEGRP